MREPYYHALQHIDIIGQNFMTQRDALPDWSFHDRAGFHRVINVAGTMTPLGASLAVPATIAAMEQILPRFVRIHDLQARASEVIAAATGSEAGFITASASAGVTLSVAAAITEGDPGRIEQLPGNPGQRADVVIQSGHLCNYGATIRQAIELPGGRVRSFGSSTQVFDYQLEAVLDAGTAAGLYVISHHVVHYGQMPLTRFAELCHGAGVPVIADAASEYDLRKFLLEGADIVLYSAHKFLGGPTAGIVAGSRALMRAAYLQNLGIGRGMKVGKESIFGAIAALQAWNSRDHDAVRQIEAEHLLRWERALTDFPGLAVKRVPDPTANPIERLEVAVDPVAAGANAAAIAAALANGDPSIVVRGHEVELGYFQLDPCNLAAGQSEIVAEQLKQVVSEAAKAGLPEPDPNDLRNSQITGYQNWLL